MSMPTLSVPLRRALTLLLCVVVFSIPVAAKSASSSLSDAELALLEELQAAERQLSITERRISDERTTLANTLSQAEQEIRRLREQTAAARRLADEATLSIQQLQTRLESWEEQSFFQQNLLGRFNQQVNSENWPLGTPLIDKIAWLGDFISQQQAMLYPIWHTSEIIMPNGELQTADELNIGPVSWFWQEQNRIGGFVDQENERSEVSLLFSGRQNNTLAALYDGQRGNIIFDPTLSRALRLAQEQESILDHIEKGGLWAIPILLFAVFALTIALMKSIQLWLLPPIVPALAERLQKYNNSYLAEKVEGMQKQLITVIRETIPGQIRDDRLFATLMECKHRLEYWLGAIAITAAVSPLLGLLGTVSGMIEAFRLMTLFGAGDPAAVSSGISEALVTTELGLIVAIPSLVLHALLSRRVKSYYTQLENSAITLSQLGSDSSKATSTFDAEPPTQGLPA
ncbi:MAG: flagellar motor protein MotA [SAR86 cluster bacterium]|uniref:Flagellar motor protein MotA n=1 Tax=SAR86 cluster bacterium TaxID=2030880 RepID=A0A2A5AHB0_9GAMM|nr:MAG: flagellar motor protein MotA [SAR86 cluster bacterium]